MEVLFDYLMMDLLLQLEQILIIKLKMEIKGFLFLNDNNNTTKWI